MKENGLSKQASELEEAMKTYRENGLPPIISLSNHENKEEIFEEIKDTPIFESMLKPYIKPSSFGEKMLNFIYGLFGSTYKKPDINSHNQQGDGILHFLFNSKKIVKALIEDMGADINLQDKEGNTPLIKAAEYGCLESVRYLIEKGANINFSNNLGENLLHGLVRTSNPRDIEKMEGMIDMLKEKGLLTKLAEQRDNSGKTPLDCAVRKDLSQLSDDQERLLSKLIESIPPEPGKYSSEKNGKISSYAEKIKKQQNEPSSRSMP